MTLNINEKQSTAAGGDGSSVAAMPVQAGTHSVEQPPGADQPHAVDQPRAATAADPPTDPAAGPSTFTGFPALDRQRLADELMSEITSLSARERMGSLKLWHRGALSLLHLHVIALLQAEGPLSMSRLADLLDVSVASAGGIVNRMEQRGYARRDHDTEDRRVVRVTLTEAGARVFEDFADLRRQHLAPIVARLSVEELMGMLKGLRAMHAARAEMLDAPGPAPGPMSEQVDTGDARDIS